MSCIAQSVANRRLVVYPPMIRENEGPRDLNWLFDAVADAGHQGDF